MKKLILLLTSLFIFLFNVQKIWAVNNNNAGINPDFYTYSQEMCTSPALAIADFWDSGDDMNPQNAIGASDENYASLGFGEYIVVDLTGSILPSGSSVTINWRRYPGADSPFVKLSESSSTSFSSWVFIGSTEVVTDNFSNYTVTVDENMRYLIIENITNNWLYVESISCTYPCPSCIDGILTLTTQNNEQTVCQNSAITDIVYSVEGGATDAEVTDLPGGLTGNFSDGIFTISGAPNESGIFSFTVRTTGTTSPCTEAVATGTITVTSNPSAPTGFPFQAFSPNTNPTIANLTVLGENIQWYTSETGGIALNPETALVDGMHYYASQTIYGCESIERFNVGVIIYASSTVTFNTTGTFVVPNGVTEITVKAWGGGGGGSGRSSSDDPERYAGSGGGGGGFASGTLPVYEGVTVTVNIGSGGKGGSGNGEDGQEGGTTQVVYFMGQLLAFGGEGGYAGSAGPGEGGSGHIASIVGIVPNFSSHRGGNGSNGDNDNGGGGGGGAGDTSDGGTGTITSGGDGGTNFGGNGGNGSTGDESGGVGLSYGGGGGGASDNDNSTGGDGGNGVAIIIWDAGGCSNPTNGGEISGNQTICPGSDPDAFTSISPASGETGTLEYKWQYSDVNDPYDWEDFASSNTATWDDNENLEGTRWYRRLARVTCSDDWTGAVSSNILEVTIEDVDEAGIGYIGSTTFCEGGSVTLAASEASSYLWSNGETTQEIIVTTSGDYYVTVTNANGCSVSTSPITITVHPMPTLSGISVDNEISCYNPDSDPVLTFSGLVPGENAIFYAINEEHMDDPLELEADANGDATYSFDLGVGTFELSIDEIRYHGCEIKPTENNSVTWTVYAVPTANAGSDGDACGLGFVLDATPSVGIGTWTKESGPGTADFSENANDPDATVTVSEYGTYVFRWTEENGSCIDYDEVTVNFYQQPVAYAGEDQSQCNNSTFTIGPATKAAIVGPTGIWEFVGDHGIAAIEDKNSETTTVTNVPFDQDITLRWIVTNGSCTDFDEVVLRNNSLPFVDAGLCRCK